MACPHQCKRIVFLNENPMSENLNLHFLFVDSSLTEVVFIFSDACLYRRITQLLKRGVISACAFRPPFTGFSSRIADCWNYFSNGKGEQGNIVSEET